MPPGRTTRGADGMGIPSKLGRATLCLLQERHALNPVIPANRLTYRHVRDMVTGAMIDNDELFTKRDATAFLKVSLPTIDRMIRRGDFPIVKLSSKAVRIRRSDFLALVAKRTITRSGED